MQYFKYAYYETTDELAARWGMSRRRVQEILTTGRITNRIPGAILVGKTWLVPADEPRPLDKRHKVY